MNGSSPFFRECNSRTDFSIQWIITFFPFPHYLGATSAYLAHQGGYAGYAAAAAGALPATTMSPATAAYAAAAGPTTAAADGRIQ